jgi:hypothetical protein
MASKTRVKQTATTTVDEVLAALERAGSAKVRDGYARYGIEARHAYGVSMGTIQKLARSYGKSHALESCGRPARTRPG